MPAGLLAEAMGNSLPLERYRSLLPAFSQFLREADCTTVDRIAMAVAQLGHESGGLKYSQEIADGSQYEGRHDLGNTQPGDGRRFKGRGWIQVTGRSNFTQCSRWAHQRGLVPTSTFFVDNPDALASDEYVGIGPTWYWTTARPQLNEASDRGDLVWATKLINGGTNGLDDRRRRYQHALNMGARLLELTKGGDVAQPVEKRLDYDRAIVRQETGYNCGPAAAQIVLAAAGITVSEQQLAREMGTHTGGTDTIDLVASALKKHAPQAKWATVWMPQDPPTRTQRDTLWDHIVSSIDAGWGLVMNWVAPPGNHPRPVPPSDPSLGPNYGGSTVWHYVACCGYLDDGTRKVWIADSGFAPYGYYVTLDQCATLIPPKGYAHATVRVAAPPTSPPLPAPDKLDTVYFEVTQRLPGRTFDDPELRDFITDPARRDTVLGHSMNAASLGRINYELLRRIAEHLNVDVSDIR